jgi:hypothetical protein
MPRFLAVECPDGWAVIDAQLGGAIMIGNEMQSRLREVEARALAASLNGLDDAGRRDSRPSPS